MNRTIVTFLVLAFITVFWACGDEKKAMGEELIKLEEAYKAENSKENADAIITKLNEFVAKFPDASEMNARYTFRAGELYFEQKDYQKSIETLQSGIENFRNDDATPKSYKLLGDIYKLQGKVTEAIITYSTLSREFPTHVAAKEAATAIPDNEAIQQRIANLEESLKNPEETSLYPSYLRTLARNMHQYAMINPDSSNAPIYLLRAGDIYGNSGDFETADKIFNSFLKQYPKHPEAAKTVFSKGFFYEKMALRNSSEREQYLAKAEEWYKKVIQDYPQSEMAGAASMSIQHLGKSDEELLESIINSKQQ